MNKPPQAPASQTLDPSEQERVRLERVKKLKNPYPNGFEPSHLSLELNTAHSQKTREELEGTKIQVKMAGRILASRSFGKAGFLRIRDRAGYFQLYVSKDGMDEESYASLLEFDTGDIVYAEGYLFKTKTGELSLHCQKIQLVTKCLKPLPEKFHGIADVEIKYRQRYLDLIVTDETRDTFKKRFQIIDEIRSFLKEKDYLEVETPMMHPIVGGANARPFKTHHNTLDMELFLRIAPELYLKRLVVGGFERVFEINRNFRNEGISIKHNPEFTMLEFYQAYATYEDLMNLTEEMFQRVADRVLGTRQLKYEEAEIQLDGRWERISVEDSIIKYSNFKDRSKIRDRGALLEYGKKAAHHMDPKDTTGGLQMVVFDHEVESKLIQPTFVTHYPMDVSPLSRRNDQDPFVVDRFELFVYGREMANAFSELNDPFDQHERFLAQVKAKEAGNEEAADMDEDYVQALQYGMPPTAGEGIGIDRLVMLFTNSSSIRDVILFPQLRKK